jgi:hypothetical protein
VNSKVQVKYTDVDEFNRQCIKVADLLAGITFGTCFTCDGCGKVVHESKINADEPCECGEYYYRYDMSAWLDDIDYEFIISKELKLVGVDLFFNEYLPPIRFDLEDNILSAWCEINGEYHSTYLPCVVDMTRQLAEAILMRFPRINLTDKKG